MSDYANLRESYYQALMVIEGIPAGEAMTAEKRASAEKKLAEYAKSTEEAAAKKTEEEAKKAKETPQPQTQAEWQAARQEEANKEAPSGTAPPTAHPAATDPHPAQRQTTATAAPKDK